MINNSYYKAALGGIVGLINMGTVIYCENKGAIIFTEGYYDYTFIQLHAGQIVGRGYTNYGPALVNNICAGMVKPGNLHTVTWVENGVTQYFCQYEYVSPYEIGWFQYVPFH